MLFITVLQLSLWVLVWVSCVRAWDPIDWFKGAAADIVSGIPSRENLDLRLSQALPHVDIKGLEQVYNHLQQEVLSIKRHLEQVLNAQDLKEFTRVFAEEIDRHANDLKQEFHFSGSEEDNDRKEWEWLERPLDDALDQIESAFMAACDGTGVAHIGPHFKRIREPLKQTILGAAKAIDRHPCLLKVLLQVLGLLVSRVMPLSWVVRALLTVLGFGVSGPIKGSFAAAFQSRVFRGAIPKGSWFAWGQSAGMSFGNGFLSYLERPLIILPILAQCAL